MKYYLFSFLCIFLSCASQGYPNGGPIDYDGPEIIKSLPNNGGISLSPKDPIIIFFNELINPISVVNAISIFPENQFSHRVIGNKIIITPDTKWNYSNIIKIKLSRKISDLRNNLMSHPIELFYFGSKLISNNMIAGQLINTDNQVFELGLYQITDSEYKLIEKTQCNEDNIFEFQYIQDGQYFIVAVADSLTNPNNDIRFRKYGMLSAGAIDFSNNDTIKIDIKIDDPIPRLSIQSFEQINNNFGYLVYDNGSKAPFIFSNIQDSLLINTNLKNRLESYTTSDFVAMLTNIIDTTLPDIESFNYLDNSIALNFTEPIKTSNGYKPIIFYVKDSVNYKLDYNMIDSLQAIILLNDNVSEIFVSNLTDLYDNVFQDTLSISINNNLLDSYIDGGNVYGSIIYNGEWPIIVKAESMNLNLEYYCLTDQFANFSFINIKPDFYTFSAFEFFGGYDSTQYFSGLWQPVSRAAKFGYYPKNLEIRKHWDLQDMIIEVK